MAINLRTILLLDKFKGSKDKAVYFLQACNQSFVQAEVLKNEVNVTTELVLMKGKWAEN